MLQSLPALNTTNSLEHLPLDNYHVPFDTITEEVKNYLLEHTNVSGVMITQGQNIIGSITRRALFEKLSKEFSYALYATKPIGVMLDSLKEKVLKIPATTLMTDAVKLSFSRPTKSIYDPIVIVKNGKEIGMLDFSKLILAQSEMFSLFNEQLTEQEQSLHDYVDRLQEQEKSVRQYASQLESQRKELQQRNGLLEEQKAKLQEQTETLSQQTEKLSRQKEEIFNLNKRFEEVGMIVSTEGKRTFAELATGVQAVIQLTEKINDISDDFQKKLTAIDQGNELINKISKRVENLSFQASIMGSSLPMDDNNKIPFTMIIEEIEKLSTQIIEANTTINNLSKDIRSQIRLLIKTAEDNQSVVTNLAQNSQKTEMALASLSQLLQNE